jgi:hypothetical protein
MSGLLLLLSMGSAAPWTDAECIDCHPGPARRWAASRHGHSLDNANFAAAHREARFADWCTSCHAATEQGVGCTACHLDHERPTAEVCEGCHEFVGPTMAPVLELAGDLLQSTVSEWRASPAAAAGETCVSCHHDGHRFRGAHDADFVRGALVVTVEPEALELRTTSALGHRLPTGDPFRRLEVERCADPSCVDVLDDQGRMRVLHDTRLGPPGGDGSHLLRVPRDGAPYWRVRLGLADPDLLLPDEERYLPLFTGAFP